MIYLLLAILSSSLISVIMRLSSDKVKGNISMLSMNYLTCAVMGGWYAGFGSLFPADPALPKTIGMGVLLGVLFLMSFILFQANVKRYGVVLPAIFMKLGLLVPLVLSIFLFGEMPSLLQAVGFFTAIAAIILINLPEKGDKSASAHGFGIALILMLIINGSGDAMSKVYEELGEPALAEQFLFYAFGAACILCAILTVLKKEKPGRNEIFFGCLIGIPNFFSAKFLLRSLEDIPAVIVYPTFSVASILLVTLAGVLIFKERLSKRQWIAMAGIMAALVMLNI